MKNGDREQREARVVGPEREVERGQVRQLRKARQHALRDREQHHERADRDVEDRLDEERGRDRRIAGVRDALLREIDLHHVAAADRHDAVDADPGDVGAEDPPPAEALVRIGGPQRVEPGPAAAADVAEVEQQRERQRPPLDGREVREERLGGIEEGVEARAEATASSGSGPSGGGAMSLS